MWQAAYRQPAPLHTHTLTHTHKWYRIHLHIHTGNPVWLTLTASWSPRLSRTKTSLLENFNHYSQMPNWAELRRFLETTFVAHCKWGTLKCLWGSGFYLKAHLFEHTQVQRNPDVIRLWLTLKWCFSLKHPDTDASPRTGRMMRWQ